MRCLLISLIASLLLVGCAAKQNNMDRISIAKVQREIKVGMTSAEVVQVLGSPNMVSTDEARREVWVYDKVATDVSTRSGGIGLGGGALIGNGLGFGSMSSSSGSSSSNQRTLTIAVKFDENSRVRDFSYHTSSF